MSVDLWLITGNNGDDWNFDNLDVNGRQRDSYYWVKDMIEEDFITRKTIPQLDHFKENDQSGNTISFLNCLTQSLNFQQDQMMNTVNVYEHCDYTIQMTYIMDYNFTNSTDFNYFATMVNTECVKVFGPAIFYKTENGLTTNLKLDELLETLLNFYHVVTYRYKNGNFEQICNRNMEHEIEAVFKSYCKRRINDWIVLSEDKDQLTRLKPSNNKLSDFNDLIWFKLKTYSGDIYHQLKDDVVSEDDFRGLYMDIGKDYILKTFF